MYNSEFYLSIGAFFIAIKFVIFVILTVEKIKIDPISEMTSESIK